MDEHIFHYEEDFQEEGSVLHDRQADLSSEQDGSLLPSHRPEAGPAHSRRPASAQANSSRPSAQQPRKASRTPAAADEQEACLQTGRSGSSSTARPESDTDMLDYMNNVAYDPGRSAQYVARPSSPTPEYSMDDSGSDTPPSSTRSPPPPHYARPQTASTSRSPGFSSREGLLENKVQGQLQKPPCDWTVPEVCDWVDFIGLGQYRKKFLHSYINGRILLKVTNDHLKLDLGIAPLGHREGLLMAIADLASARPALRGRRRPTSAPQERLSDGAAIHAEQQRNHLLHELEKANARAAHRKSVAGQAMRTAALADAEIQRLAGAVADLELRFHLPPSSQRPLSRQGGQLVDGIDCQGTIPWHPAGRCISPSPESAKQKAVQARRSPGPRQAAASSTFLSRLHLDIQGRRARLQAKEASMYAPDPVSVKRRHEKDLQFLRQCLGDKLGDAEMDAAIDDIVYRYQSGEAGDEKDREISRLQAATFQKQGDKIKKLGGARKLEKLAAFIRTDQFLQRYRTDLNSRKLRISELAKKWDRLLYGGMLPEDKEAADFKACKAHWEGCGWDASDFDYHSAAPAPAEEKFDALLKRVQALQEAQVKKAAGSGNGQVDWSATAFREDGLEEQQAAKLAEVKHEAAEEGKGDAPVNLLLQSVEMLARCRKDELDKLTASQGYKRCLAMYRALQTQRFIDFTSKDLREREAKMASALAALAPRRKLLSQGEADAFLNRLLNDTDRRRQRQEELSKAAAHAELAKLEAGRAALAALRTPSRATSRPASSRGRHGA
ncbi:hypothetical protein WJX72_008293 [[Myrmecia] bisecta]|uniref:SAM domain-containing protein n=1 Tax=[Myrmecia] bisecta TaxID=41462 RepID=A0AAW1Q9M4_9CHLO